MEGTLYKWSGYLSGWNTKYVVLTNGTICFFNNKQDRDSNKPACESLNMGLCEIVLDTNSTTQWELRVPSVSKFWYLRTESTPERNQWIKALGSAKACLLDTSSLCSFSRSTSVASSTHVVPNESPATEETSLQSLGTENMGFEFVKDVSEAVNDSGNGSMNNLLVNVDSSSFVVDQSLDYVENLNGALANQCQSVIQNVNQLHACLTTPQENDYIKHVINEAEISMQVLMAKLAEYKLAASSNLSSKEGPTQEASDDLQSNLDTGSEAAESDQDNKESINKLPTFFSLCDVNFGHVLSAIKFKGEEKLISLDVFLNACQTYMNFFDRFAGTVMAPLKTDIQGNINKLRKVMAAEPTYKYPNDILEKEIPAKEHNGPDSGTQALLWLTRAIRVMSAFLTNLLSYESENRHDTGTSLISSYSKLLAKHHNWMVQRLFKMGLKMIPSYETFKMCMTNDETLKELKQTEGPAWEDVVEKEVDKQGFAYSNEMWNVSVLIQDLYKSYNIEV